jgi:glyoxylase-like metal-dependent hydrolase (beta-lactamase superfamily II)
VPTLHDLQWQYGMPDAVGAALHSAVGLARRAPRRLLPSHGQPMDDGPTALAELAGNLRTLARHLSEIRRNRVWTTWPSSVDQPIAHPLPHLWFNGLSVANTYALVDDAGDALILDYGFPSWDHLFADQRFAAHTLDAFRDEAGLRRVKAAIPSHYHDDHLAGVPWLQREHGAQAWIHQSFAEIATAPERFDLPCLWAEPIRVDRILADGDLVEHAGARLEAFHMPGHTMFALGLGGTLDGVRVAYTGDNLLAGSLSPLRAAAPIYRNVMRHDSIRVGVERLIGYEPELLLTGHTGALEVTRADLDEFVAWARELELIVERLAPVPGLPDEALDPYPGWFDPYRGTVPPGGTLATTVIVRNHAPIARDARVRIRMPRGWTASPADATVLVPGRGGTASLPVTIAVPGDTAAGRAVVTVDLHLGSESRGEVAETLIEVTPA